MFFFKRLTSKKSMNSVSIGKQVWANQNLTITTFRNGDIIPEAKSNSEWKKAGENKQPAWCYYDNSLSNGEKFGILYNWYAVNDPRGLAPEGWHIPSDEEWTELSNALGGSEVAGEKMKTTTEWRKNKKSTNESGFSAFPAGYREDDGKFYVILVAQDWWSSTELSEQVAWIRGLVFNYATLEKRYSGKANGLSVRCLKD